MCISHRSITKNEVKVHFYFDYFHLNTNTRNNTYNLLGVDDCINSLGDANIFMTLDSNSGY